MHRSIERKLRNFSYKHRGISRHLACLCRSFNEVVKILEGGGKRH